MIELIRYLKHLENMKSLIAVHMVDGGEPFVGTVQDVNNELLELSNNLTIVIDKIVAIKEIEQ
jgi:hypothetical protein